MGEKLDVSSTVACVLAEEHYRKALASGAAEDKAQYLLDAANESLMGNARVNFEDAIRLTIQALSCNPPKSLKDEIEITHDTAVHKLQSIHGVMDWPFDSQHFSWEKRCTTP